MTKKKRGVKKNNDDEFSMLGKNFLFGIGINEYNNFAKLANAKKDVEEIKQVLVENYDFESENCKLLIDNTATREEILENLDRFRDKNLLTENDRLLIYYAGHGYFDNERGFWIPVDAKKGRTSSYISNAEVRDIISNMAARHVLLISDSCFSGSLLVRSDILNDSPAITEWDKKRSRFIFCSGKGIVSDGVTGGNSPFAQQILYQLRTNKGKNLNIVRLADEVTKSVRFNYEQQAECCPLFQSGHDGGQFIFSQKQLKENVALTNLQDEELLKKIEELKIHHQYEIEKKNRFIELIKDIEVNMVLVKGGTFNRFSTHYEDVSTGFFGAFSPKIVTKTINQNVTVSDFYIGKLLVTEAQWEAVMGKKSLMIENDPDHPVVCQNHSTVKKFCEKLSELTGKNYRLPTESEWEYAASGGIFSNHHEYAGSNNIDEVAWYIENSNKETKQVGLKRPNELGLYDMSGNVWEWCDDVWNKSYEGASIDGSAMTKGGGNNKVIRGGSSSESKENCKIYSRAPAIDNYPTGAIGFRCARDIG